MAPLPQQYDVLDLPPAAPEKPTSRTSVRAVLAITGLMLIATAAVFGATAPVPAGNAAAVAASHRRRLQDDSLRCPEAPDAAEAEDTCADGYGPRALALDCVSGDQSDLPEVCPEQVPITTGGCADGSDPVQDDGSIGCEDGSKPLCQDGRSARCPDNVGATDGSSEAHQAMKDGAAVAKLAASVHIVGFATSDEPDCVCEGSCSSTDTITYAMPFTHAYPSCTTSDVKCVGFNLQEPVDGSMACDIIEGDAKCGGFPCRNGGICTSQPASIVARGYQCVCPPAFYGVNCQYNVDECSLPRAYSAFYAQPASADGQYTNPKYLYPCGNEEGPYKSVCTDMVGQLDEMWCSSEDECARYFQNDKQCVDCANNKELYAGIKGAGYRCECETVKAHQLELETGGVAIGRSGNGYRVGEAGSTTYPPIDPIMKKLGGLAADETPSGCVDVDDCASNPCLNAGTCTDLGLFMYSCACVNGWVGKDCEEDVNECETGTHTCVENFLAETVCLQGDTVDCQARATIQGRGEHTWITTNGEETSATAIPYGRCENLMGAKEDGSGRWTCICERGWLGDAETTGTGCTDKPNCDENSCANGGTCSEPPEMFATDDVHCDCPLGWNGLDEKNPTPPYEARYCQNDDNECEIEGRNNCDIQATCTNVDGSYTCACNEGWTGTGYTCIDADDCEFSPCANGGTCSDIGTLMFNCECVPGWRGPKCEDDWNECTMGIHACHNDASCLNTAGSYMCRCDPGYSGDGWTVCDDVDDCFEYDHVDPNMITDESVCKHGTCEDRGANYFVCTCDAGYTDSNCDRDTDECNLIDGTNDCDVNAQCVNAPGSYECECNTGFTGIGNRGNCAQIMNCDTNPCDATGAAGCQEEEAAGVPGLYECTCKAGYTDTKCSADIDECDVTTGGNVCAEHAECLNSPGSYDCQCRPGFTGNGLKTDLVASGTGCVDIDDCSSGPCDHGTCEGSLPNIFSCACEDGWTDTKCDFDVNECFLKTHTCDEVAKCVNSPGAFRCRCTSGYEGDGYDESVTHTDDTARDMFLEKGGEGDDADRNNLLMTRDNKDAREHVGAEDLVGTKAFGCLDLDDCASLPCDPERPQSPRGTCEDMGPNEFFCHCEIGWQGALCTVDINECGKPVNDCDNRDEAIYNGSPMGGRSICTNSPGSHSCECSQGYYDTENTLANPNDGTGASCNLCTQCQIGYKQERACQPLDRTCVNVDECTEEEGELNNCHIKSSCTDTDGSFSCECNGGFYGNGIECTECTVCNPEGEHQVSACTSTANRVCALHVPSGLYTVASEAGGESECLAFRSMAVSDQAFEKYPMRIKFGTGGDFCGYNSGDSPDCPDTTAKECALASKSAVFYFHHVENYHYTMSSQLGDTWKCMTFGGTSSSSSVGSTSRADQYPSRDEQLDGPLCQDGESSAPALRAVWQVKPIDREEKKFMLQGTKTQWITGAGEVSADIKYECLAFMEGGQDTNPSLHGWGGAGDLFCGMPNFENADDSAEGESDQLEDNKLAVWILDQLSGPP